MVPERCLRDLRFVATPPLQNHAACRRLRNVMSPAPAARRIYGGSVQKWSGQSNLSNRVAAIDPKLPVVNGGYPEAKTTIQSDLPRVSTASAPLRSGVPTSRQIQ